MTRRPVVMPAGRFGPEPPGSGGDSPARGNRTRSFPPASPGGVLSSEILHVTITETKVNTTVKVIDFYLFSSDYSKLREDSGECFGKQRLKPPDVQMGAFGLYWVLSHTIQYAPGGVGQPIKIAVLKKRKGEWIAQSVEGAELQEPEQHVVEIEKLIAEYPKGVVEGADKTSPPPVPPPETPGKS